MTIFEDSLTKKHQKVRKLQMLPTLDEFRTFYVEVKSTMQRGLYRL